MGLETLVEWLRPLAQTKAWEYCVVWKLGDDPSRWVFSIFHPHPKCPFFFPVLCLSSFNLLCSVAIALFFSFFRFIEWIGCCCSGGVDGDENVKEEPGEEHHASPPCRDVHVEHPMRTKACQALAQLPSSMPLYSGYKLSFSDLSSILYLSFCNKNINTNEVLKPGFMERL